MTKIKKITAVLLSVVMFVCCFNVAASAVRIPDKAMNITSGKTYSTKIKDYYGRADYKIQVSKSGELIININFCTGLGELIVLNSDGNTIKCVDKTICGITDYPSDWTGTRLQWDRAVEKYSGVFTYSVEKGIYYISVVRYGVGSGELSISAEFPYDSSASGKLTGIVIPMKVGATMQLSVAASGSTSGTITWSSSKTSVATVSSTGKVIAKKRGTTTITAKLGSSKASIVIQVS